CRETRHDYAGVAVSIEHVTRNDEGHRGDHDRCAAKRNNRPSAHHDPSHPLNPPTIAGPPNDCLRRGGSQPSGPMFIPVFHEPDYDEWHGQQVHNEMQRDANTHGKFLAEVDRAEQRAQTDRLADEDGGIGQHDVLVEVEGLDVESPTYPPVQSEVIEKAQGGEKDTVADDMQDFQAQHPAPRSVRRGSHYEADSINQIAGPRRDPWRVTAANFR